MYTDGFLPTLQTVIRFMIHGASILLQGVHSPNSTLHKRTNTWPEDLGGDRGL